MTIYIKTIKQLLTLWLFITTGNVFANELVSTQLQNALKIAQDQQLHKDPDWQHLIQYIDQTFSNTSQIKSGDSFLASDGKRNPESELSATISAFFKPVSEFDNADEHPRCKFIARYHFLSNFLPFPESIQTLECIKFNEWVNLDELESVSLVFASGYFKNPASFYGHPLLKFNSNENDSSAGLLDIAITNGAIVPPNENSILYLFKGVFGGYDAGFSDAKFFQLNHDYSEEDLRDLWVYELNLTHEQKLRIAYYSWELLTQRFTYRFLQQNCGYFLEDLLQYALKQRISPRRKLYTLPATTFFNLVETTIDGRPLVKNITRVASRQNRLYEKYIDLNDLEKSMVTDFVDTSEFIKKGTETEQLRAIDTLIDYYTFLISKEDDPNHENSQPYTINRTELYRLRLSLAKNEIEWPEKISSTPPHAGSRPSLVQLGVIHNSEFGEGFRIRIRPASYDLIDLDEGHIPNSTLNMFNIEAVSINGKQRLTRFDLVNIQTLNISRTGLPGDGGLGWGLRVGFERAENSCLNCLVGQVSGSAIKGTKISDRWTLYGELEGTYHSNYEDRSLRLTAQAGLVGNITPSWKSQLILGQRAYVDGNNQTDTLAVWRNRFGNNPKSNFILDISHDGTTEAHFNYGIYW